MSKTSKIVIRPDGIHLIGKQLQDLRLQESVSQDEMASKLKIQQSNVSYIENKRTGPSLLPLTQFLDALGYQLVIQKK